MCFLIDDSRRAPSRKTALKIVILRPDGYPRSIYHWHFIWQPGEVIATPRRRRSRAGAYAYRGIYVYLTANPEFALRAANIDRSNALVLKVEVDPADWLHTGHDYGVRPATYSRVYVPECQPYFDWIDP